MRLVEVEQRAARRQPPLGEVVSQRIAARSSQDEQDEQHWVQPLSRHLPRDDRDTLLQLMSDPLYQHTKLGGSFSPARQQRRQGFWRAAAAYLQQPLARVKQTGMRLRSGGCMQKGMLLLQ